MVNMRRLSKRLPMMGASLFLAFCVWLLVIAEAKIEAGFLVPLVFDNIPSTVVIDGTPTGSVYVQIRGSKQAVAKILPQQVRAHVDLSDAKPGNEFIQITRQDIILPQGITVLGVYPPYLDIKFLARRPVPVEVRTIGKPAEGFEVREVSAIPLQVGIVGPPGRIERIETVRTYPIAVAGMKKREKVRAELVQPGDDIRLLQLKPTEVMIDIVERQIEKTFKEVPVQGGEGGAEVAPKSVTVIITGGYHRVRNLDEEQISVLVDWESAGPDPTVRPLKTTVPDGLSVVSCSPNRVKIK